MNVFALGGSGKVGLPAVRLLAESDLIDEIAVAGRNLAHAQQVAGELGSKAHAIGADGTDEDQMASLLHGYDIVVNSAMNNTVEPTIRACIRAGVDYCDVNVHVPALTLSAEAERAGIASIIASGICPCISNLMGVHAARHLDEVAQLQLGFADIFSFATGRELTPELWLGNTSEALAALHECRMFVALILRSVENGGMRNVRVLDHGQWREGDVVKDGLEAPLPEGGTTISYPYATVDPLFPSLPHDRADAAPVDMYFSPLPPELHALLRKLSLRVAAGEIDAETATSAFYEAVDGDPKGWLSLQDELVLPAEIWVRAVGRKDNRPARSTCWFTAATWNVDGYEVCGVSLAVTALKMLRGDVREPGVTTAEKAFEPMPFLDEVAAQVLPPEEKLIETSLELLD